MLCVCGWVCVCGACNVCGLFVVCVCGCVYDWCVMYVLFVSACVVCVCGCVCGVRTVSMNVCVCFVCVVRGVWCV